MSLDDKASQQSKLLLAQLWCCQGNLPCTLKPTDVALPQQEVDIPGQLVLATNPTAPRYPSFESNAQWQLVKLLGGTLSDLLEHPAPEHALKNILQLAAAKDYCELTNDIISVSHKQGVRPVTIDGHALFVTGNDIDITLSPDSHIGVLAQLLNGFYQQFCRYDRYIKVTVHQLGLNDSTLDFPLYTPWDE